MIKAVIPLFASLCLSGCFEVDQSFTFHEDDTATMVMDIAMEASLVSMMEQDGETFCSNDTAAGIGAEAIRGEVSRSHDGDDVVCRMVFTGKVEDIVSAANQASESPDAPKTKLSVSFTENDGEKTLTIEIPPLDKSGQDSSMDPMFISMMQGRTLTWTINAHEIIETTGQLSEDHKSATYVLPISEFIMNDSEIKKFTTTFITSEPSWLDIFN